MYRSSAIAIAMTGTSERLKGKSMGSTVALIS